MSAPLASEATRQQEAAGSKVEEVPLAAAVKGTGPGRITRVSSDMYGMSVGAMAWRRWA